VAGDAVNDLLVIVPSRGRPGNVARLADAMEKTCWGDTTLLVGLDDDDPELAMYPSGVLYELRTGLHQVVAWVNELAVPRTSEYRFIGTIGDDNVPRTSGWDVTMMNALEKNPFAFGNDLYPFRPPGALCCHVFCRSEVIAALGYFGPPALRHAYVDDVWMAWGLACGITFREDVIIEHLHYTNGAAHDDTYARSQALMGADQAAYVEYCRDGLAADIAKISAVAGPR